MAEVFFYEQLRKMMECLSLTLAKISWEVVERYRSFGTVRVHRGLIDELHIFGWQLLEGPVYFLLGIQLCFPGVDLLL